mgnify:CR=1 FL=1
METRVEKTDWEFTGHVVVRVCRKCRLVLVCGPEEVLERIMPGFEPRNGLSRRQKFLLVPDPRAMHRRRKTEKPHG